jgi:hypothetical protein
VFKKSILLIGLAATMLVGRAQGFSYLPAATAWRLAWDDTDGVDVPLTFELYYEGQKIAALTSDDYKLESTVGGTRTFSALVPAAIVGISKVTLVSIDPTGQRSDPSLPLTIRALGKPSAPQNLAKH